MVKAYFRIALRTLFRHKTYSLINLFGLTIGICACLVIWVITQYEFSFDKFQLNRDRIFRITTSEQLIQSDPVHILPAVIPPMADAVRTEIPGIETLAAYHILFDAQAVVPSQGNALAAFPSTPVVARPEYFSIMPYEWLAGDQQTALSETFQVVLTVGKAH